MDKLTITKTDTFEEINVFIFETEDELNQALEDKILSLYSSYAVLEDLI